MSEEHFYDITQEDKQHEHNSKMCNTESNFERPLGP